MRERLRRITATRPELIPGEHTGVTFVNVLFGIVVSSIVVTLAKDISDAVQDVSALRETRLMHLLVGVVITVGSWIGYHTSQHRPQFRIQIVNLPFWQFFLDVSMVFVYFLVLQFAEQSPSETDVTLIRPGSAAARFVADDARPEATLVAVAFLLYVLWDYVSLRLRRDRAYTDLQNRTPSPNEPFGPRRWVTMAFWIVTSAVTAAAWWAHPREAGGVIAIDAVLIALLVAYRVAKPFFDPEIRTRPAT